MPNDKKFKSDSRRPFPGGFFVFLFFALLLMVGIQSLAGDRLAKVSFSHQVEHLVNLHLTIPEENRKIAQTENLVTFSGKFRDQFLDEGEERYCYLDLLNRNHQLEMSQNQLLSDLDGLKKNVQDASDLYLHLSDPEYRADLLPPLK